MRFYSPKKKPRSQSNWHSYYTILPRRIGNHIYCFHWVLRRGKYEAASYGHPGYWEWEFGL